MNKRLSALPVVLLLTVASSAFAASSTDLTVTGLITPVSCTPSLANGGIVDYGKISAKDLYQNRHTRLEDKSIQLTVSCNAASQFAIRTLDNREDTSSLPGGTQDFGLGLINGDEKLGNYSLEFKNPVADVALKTLWSSDEGHTWKIFPEGELLVRSFWYAFGNTNGGVSAPAFLQQVTVDMAVYTQIAPANTLNLTNEVRLDGSATLQIEYL